MKTAYKYRAYPSKEQKAILNRQMFLAKEPYNMLLEKSKAYYKETGKTLTEYRMSTWLTQIKKKGPDFAELHSQVLQNVSKRVSGAYRHFFRRCKEKKGKSVKVGFPRYKKFVSSLTYPLKPKPICLRIISRRKEGSHKRRKAVLNFARKYGHIARMREDWLHKLSHNLVNSYSSIAYEELKTADMMKDHLLARSIGEGSWGNLINYLQYKAEGAGCAVVGVNPEDTSKTCSECGNVQDMPLSERAFHCQKSGISKDRDLNASINMLKRATSGQGGSHAPGDIVRPSAMEADAIELGTIRVAS